MAWKCPTCGDEFDSFRGYANHYNLSSDHSGNALADAVGCETLADLYATMRSQKGNSTARQAASRTKENLHADEYGLIAVRFSGASDSVPSLRYATLEDF